MIVERLFTNAELAECAEREVKIRQQVYPRRILTRRMSAKNADKQLAMMRKIAEDYRLRAEADLWEERLL